MVSLWHLGKGLEISALTSEVEGQCLDSVKNRGSIYSPNGTGLFPKFFFRPRDSVNLKNLNS